MMERGVTCVSVFSLLVACVGTDGPVQVPRVEDLNVPEQINQTPDIAPPEDANPDQPDDVLDDLVGTEEPDPVEEEDPQGPEFDETLIDSEEQAVPLIGVIAVTDAESGQLTLALREGTFLADDHTSILGDLPITLTDDIPGSYTTASSFVQSDAQGIGVVGIPSDAILTSELGTATFRGGAVGFVIEDDRGIDLVNGSSIVTVNFDDLLVSADLSDFDAISQIGGKLVDAPFDVITLSESAISESGFSGGILTTTLDGAIVDIVGADARLEAQGQFFGVDDATGLPLEVGGLVYSEGESGIIFGGFIAD